MDNQIEVDRLFPVHIRVTNRQFPTVMSEYLNTKKEKKKTHNLIKSPLRCLDVFYRRQWSKFYFFMDMLFVYILETDAKVLSQYSIQKKLIASKFKINVFCFVFSNRASPKSECRISVYFSILEHWS